MTPRHSYHFTEIDYLVAAFSGTGLILLYLFFSSWPHVSYGIFSGWFAYYILFYSILALITAYKLRIQSRSSKLLALCVVLFGLFSIIGFFLVIGTIDFVPVDTTVTVKTTPEIRNPNFWQLLYSPFFFMDWVQFPEVKLIGIVLVYFSLKGIKVIRTSFENPNSC